MTQLEMARSGKVTPEMEIVAAQEELSPGYIRSGVADGAIVILHNTKRVGVRFCGVGAGLRTAEHLCLPTVEDVRQGVVAARIAAHVADLAKGSKAAYSLDADMGRARKDLDWDTQAELAVDPEMVRLRKGENPSADTEACTMCGKFCALKMVREYLQTQQEYMESNLLTGG